MLLLQSAIKTLPTDQSISSSLFKRRTTLLPKPFFPGFDLRFRLGCRTKKASHLASKTRTHATLLDAPVLWAGRVAIFYVLLKADSENGDADDMGFAKWFDQWRRNPEKEAADKRKLVSKWHPTTKGTLRRNYRVPSKSEGRRLLRDIASLLSDDDHFRDATSHKGCQIRRESAHGESVCCNNVRALFDELPTPHLIVEITPFPVGPLTENDYIKAEKLEVVLRSGPSV